MDSENKLDEILSKYKIQMALSLVGMVLLIGGLFSSGIIGKTFIKSTKQPSSQAYTQSAKPFSVKVDVSGAVGSPGVYTLTPDSRVEDAIKAAGGVTESADPIYVSKTINLAQKISDGMKIYVPISKEAGASAAPSDVQGASTTQGLVNINMASLVELDKLSGVGAVTAQKIIDSRPYSSIEELLTKKAVTRSVYEKIKGVVSVW